MARLRPLGPGKDSTAGHWELMGVVVERALPTYPEGFRQRSSSWSGGDRPRARSATAPCNGIAAIEQFGAEHLRTGELILYTSQDSVLQLAAHVERVPRQSCTGLRNGPRGAAWPEHAVGRVIARPFAGARGRLRRASTGGATSRSRRLAAATS